MTNEFYAQTSQIKFVETAITKTIIQIVVSFVRHDTKLLIYREKNDENHLKWFMISSLVEANQISSPLNSD
jgi:hypothetical protein